MFACCCTVSPSFSTTFRRRLIMKIPKSGRTYSDLAHGWQRQLSADGLKLRFVTSPSLGACNSPTKPDYSAFLQTGPVKITSGDVMSRVSPRLSRRSLAFYYGKVPSFTYSSLREYKPAVYFSF